MMQQCAEWADKRVYDDVEGWIWVSSHVEHLQRLVIVEAIVICLLVIWIGGSYWRRA